MENSQFYQIIMMKKNFSLPDIKQDDDMKYFFSFIANKLCNV